MMGGFQKTTPTPTHPWTNNMYQYQQHLVGVCNNVPTNKNRDPTVIIIEEVTEEVLWSSKKGASQVQVRYCTDQTQHEY